MKASTHGAANFGCEIARRRVSTALSCELNEIATNALIKQKNWKRLVVQQITRKNKKIYKKLFEKF